MAHGEAAHGDFGSMAGLSKKREYCQCQSQYFHAVVVYVYHRVQDPR